MRKNSETDVPEPILEQIARDHLDVPTLATRRTDALDFHEVAVWQVREALAAAYRAGVAAAKAEVRS
jgi:hypothetical protein